MQPATALGWPNGRACCSNTTILHRSSPRLSPCLLPRLPSPVCSAQSAESCPTDTENEDKFFAPEGAPKREFKNPCDTKTKA